MNQSQLMMNQTKVRVLMTHPLKLNNYCKFESTIFVLVGSSKTNLIFKGQDEDFFLIFYCKPVSK